MLIEFDAMTDEEAHKLGFVLEYRLAEDCQKEPYEHLSSQWKLEQVAGEPTSPLWERKVIRQVELDDELFEWLEREMGSEFVLDDRTGMK